MYYSFGCCFGLFVLCIFFVSIFALLVLHSEHKLPIAADGMFVLAMLKPMNEFSRAFVSAAHTHTSNEWFLIVR